MLIGAQLFTLRDACQTLEGLDDTLKRVADMGMTTVQLSGVCAYEPEWMAEKLKAYGLSAPITHFAYDRITGDPAATLKFHQTMGTPYIGIGIMPLDIIQNITQENLGEFLDTIRPAVDCFAAAGSKFMYHNHWHELGKIADRYILDIICEAFPADRLGITADVYWMQHAGEDPVAWLHKLKGRTDCVHFKDMVKDAEGKNKMVANGEGTEMDYPAILKACVDTGVKYGFIEQDDCGGEDPFECMKRSFAYFKAQGFEG
jgi:sugar phosphate isomerase/epimerase